MTSGIRATVEFPAPDGCPVAQVSMSVDTSIDQTSTSVTVPDGRGSVTEFLVDGDPASDEDWEREPVFSYGTANLYRTAHDGDSKCPCEFLGQFGCPVHRYIADGGNVTLTFHAEDYDQLQDVMAAFRERYATINVQRLLQPPLEGTPQERVFVNRGRLTDRQLEVLTTAYERGYFERPRRANATEIATELGISPSTFTEHLVTAQRKLLQDVLEETQ